VDHAVTLKLHSGIHCLLPAASCMLIHCQLPAAGCELR